MACEQDGGFDIEVGEGRPPSLFYLFMLGLTLAVVLSQC